MTPDQFAQVMVVVWKVTALLVFGAAFLGAMLGRASYDGLWLFLRRSPRLRRFDRAMRKVMA